MGSMSYRNGGDPIAAEWSRAALSVTRPETRNSFSISQTAHQSSDGRTIATTFSLHTQKNLSQAPRLSHAEEHRTGSSVVARLAPLLPSLESLAALRTPERRSSAWAVDRAGYFSRRGSDPAIAAAQDYRPNASAEGAAAPPTQQHSRIRAGTGSVHH